MTAESGSPAWAAEIVDRFVRQATRAGGRPNPELDVLGAMLSCRRRLSSDEISELPARAVEAIPLGGAFLLASQSGPGWSASLVAREDAGGAERGNFRFEAIRMEARPGVATLRSYRLPFLLRRHFLSRFVQRTGRWPGEVFGPHPSGLAQAIRYQALSALSLSRMVKSQEELEGARTTFSFLDGAIMGKGSFVGDWSGPGHGHAVTVVGEGATRSDLESPLATPEGHWGGRGRVIAGDGATFVAYGRLVDRQRQVLRMARQLNWARGRDMNEAFWDLFLVEETASADEVLEEHPELFEELEAHIRKCARDADEGPSDIIGCDGSDDQPPAGEESRVAGSD